MQTVPNDPNNGLATYFLPKGIRNFGRLTLVKLPEGLTWKKLKDISRYYAEVQPKWTSLNAHGATTSVGCPKAARKLYEGLSQFRPSGKLIFVVYFDTSEHLETFKYMACNCRSLGCVCTCRQGDFQSGMYLTRREESHVAVPSRFAGQPLATSPYSSVPPDAGVRISPVPQQVRSYATYPPYPSQGRTPQYGQAANGTPVNMSNGAVRTEARGVFISGLPFTTKKTDLENALRRYGRLVKCELPPHQSKAGMARGTATAEFTTLEAAETAVLNFNSYGGRQIKVRFDRESTKSGPLAEEPPIVLNGSTGGSGSAY